MSTANKYTPATNVQPPRCPYCAHDLLEVSAYNWTMPIATGLGVMLAMYCPNIDCRKIIGTQILIVPHQADEDRRIVGPH